MDTKKYEVNSKSLIIENIDIINELFEGDINEIFTKLKNKNTEFENKIYESFCKKCPMSLAVTEKLINDAKGKTLKECLETEFQLSQKIVYRDDFNNGVNSVLVSKDRNPQWQPSKLSEINIDDINKYFEIHTEKLYL